MITMIISESGSLGGAAKRCVAFPASAASVAEGEASWQRCLQSP